MSVREVYVTTEVSDPACEDSGLAKTTLGVIITDAAIEKVKVLLQREGRDDLRLRVAVQPGGCSGLRYQLFFDDRLFDGDQVIRFGEAEDRVPEPDSVEVSGDEGGPDE
jgi:hypothetical protein